MAYGHINCLGDLLPIDDMKEKPPDAVSDEGMASRSNVSEPSELGEDSGVFTSHEVLLA